jgi:ferritin-like metal-binding protein YciE
MKTSCRKYGRPIRLQDEFEDALMAELEELRKSEKALQKMYPRLKHKPKLRIAFLQQLADMQRRAERLDGVLNPIGALRFASLAPVHGGAAV